MTFHLNGSSEFLRHEPCPECGSSDANSVDTDGHTYCCVCHHYVGGDKENHTHQMKTDVYLQGYATPLKRRGISEKTCEFYKIYKDGELLRFHYFTDDGVLQGAKVKSKNIYLLSAIGDNRGFKKTVEKIGANIVGHSKFLDHYKFKASDLQKVQNDAKKFSANYIITTEKDLVKIPDINPKIPVYALKTEMHFSPDNKLEDKINSLFI